MIQYQYLPGYIGAALMLCLLLGMLFACASRIGVQKTINRRWNRSCVVFVMFALIATMYGGGKTNAVHEASSSGVSSVMMGAAVLSPPPVSSGTNDAEVLPPLEISSVCLDEYSFGGTFTWRGQDGVPSETTMDIFATWPTLTNRWRWVGSADVLGPVVSQQWSVATYQLGVVQMPSGLFVKFKERTTSAATMEDWDGDLLPGVYEVWNRTNPYVPDFENAPKLTVGSCGQYSSLMGALAATTPYSIVQLPADETITVSSISMPPYPVMIIGPTNGYAHVESVGSPYAFALQDGQDCETLFQNVYLELLPSSSLQTGFWCGGNVPGISGYPAASATFRNVYLRATGSAAQGMGWYFRKWHETPAVLDHCLVNAAGSSNFIGISAVDAPRLEIRNCTFVNFPKMDADEYGVAIQIEQTTYASGSPTTTVANCVFDNSFTNAYPLGRLGDGYVVNAENTAVPRDFIGSHRPDACAGIVYASNCVAWTGHAISGSIVDEMGIGALAPIGNGSSLDSDNDGLTDWEEVYQYGTDPFKADSDGDGISDCDEVLNDSNPLAALDFAFQITVGLPAAYATNSMVWVSFDDARCDSVSVPGSEKSVVLPIYHVSNGIVPLLVFSNQTHSVSMGFDVSGFSIVLSAPDSDNDKMDDFWELSAGLCPTNSTDAIEDFDGDSLINLHEYWAGCNPFAMDGSNTVLSVMSRSVDQRLVGSSPSCLYESYTLSAVTNGLAIRSSNWAKDIDLSAASPWNGWHSCCEAGVLLTRRHVLFARHYLFHFGQGDRKLYFRPRDGGCYVATVVDTNASLKTDFTVALLDRDVPDSVSTVRILPSNYFDYIGNGSRLPMLTFDQEEKTLVHNVGSFPSTPGNVGAEYPSDLLRMSFSEPIVVGDSGDPRFLIMGSTPILVSTLWSGPNSPASGPFVTVWRDEVQQLIDELSNAAGLNTEEYQIEEYDFEGYSTLVNGGKR